MFTISFPFPERSKGPKFILALLKNIFG